MKIELYIPRSDAGTRNEYQLLGEIQSDATPNNGMYIRYDKDLYKIEDVILSEGRVGVFVKKVDARSNTHLGVFPN